MPLLFLALALFSDGASKWTDQAELSGVWTGGNASSSTVGLRNKLVYKWNPGTQLEWRVDGIRVVSTSVSRVAIPLESGPGYEIVEDRNTKLTAENYRSRMAYRRQISGAVFWFGRFEWRRNQFAGIDNRTTFSGGVGNTWLNTEKLVFSTGYALDYTLEDPVFESVVEDRSYAAFSLEYKLDWKATGTTTFEQELDLVVNAERSKDFNNNLDSGLKVAINDHFALKMGFVIRYANDPEKVQVPVQDSTEKVVFQLDEIDTTLTSSLVITF